MPAHGYLVFLVRAGVSHRPGELYRLNAVGQNAEDLLQFVHYHSNALGRGYHPLDRSAEGFRVKENALRGRTYWMKINRGPAGIPGETYDLDQELSTPTTERQALLSGLRALFVLPEDSYFGLLFVERAGRRHLRNLLYDYVVRLAGSSTNSTVRLEAFAELEDWRRELSSLQVLRVSESLVRRDSGDDASTVRDTVVHISAEGAMVSNITARLKDLFESKIARRDDRLSTMRQASVLGEQRRRASAEGVAFQNQAEYDEQLEHLSSINQQASHDPALFEVLDEVLPIDREVLDHRQFQVAFGEQRPERNIIIERDSLPQFVYENSARLSDGALRNSWVDHAESILGKMGVKLPVGWDR